MSEFSALPSASVAGGWSWPVFWLVCPFLVMAVLLAVIALVALLRAPRDEVATILGIFVLAFRFLAARTPGTQPTDGEGFDVTAAPGHPGPDSKEAAAKVDLDLP